MILGDAFDDTMANIRAMEEGLDTVYTVDRQESSQSKPLGSRPSSSKRTPKKQEKPKSTATGKIPWKLIAGGLAIGAAGFFFTRKGKR